MEWRNALPLIAPYALARIFKKGRIDPATQWDKVVCAAQEAPQGRHRAGGKLGAGADAT